MTDLNIRVGGKYRTRGGGAAFVQGFDRFRHRHPYEGVIVRPGLPGIYEISSTWTLEGRYLSHRESQYDLVSEITETAGERLVRAAKEASSIARGEAQPVAVHFDGRERLVMEGEGGRADRAMGTEDISDQFPRMEKPRWIDWDRDVVRRPRMQVSDFSSVSNGARWVEDFPSYMPIGTPDTTAVAGLTKRDWFAGQAIRARYGDGKAMTPEDAARLAFQLADAMIAEGGKA